ncbi:MAG: YmdB family metallophosphoesterase [Lawsonibacter sp.]|nr:YmdB family metallophosphoesterase [Lawsonibacter sp.]
MLLNVLAVGDVVGEGGQDILSRRLPSLREKLGVHFAVVNGENASGVGITPAQARRILEAGADVITLGNHTWNRIQIGAYLDKEERILRPANYAGRVAEATSEKGAMGWHLDGRAAAVWGTHTHVPTADCRVLPGGAGFVTDLGMTGPINSVLGIKPENSLNLFLGGLPRRYEEAEGSCKLNACLFTIDTDKKKCVSVTRTDITE